MDPQKKTTVTICTEEYIDKQMLRYLFTLIPDIFKSERDETINPLYLWKYDSEFNISIVKHSHIKKVKIVYVSPKYHKGQSFADVNIYISDKTIKCFGCPHAVIEITKNDSGDSGNMCYQRLEKFTQLLRKYPGVQFCKYIVYNITRENKSRSKTWEISKIMCDILGIKMVEIRSGKVVQQTNLKIPETFVDFSDIVNGTRKGGGVSNRIFVEPDKIQIQANLVHTKSKGLKSNIHDPNTGFVCAVYEILKYFYKVDTPIYIVNHGLTQEHIHGRINSKLFHILNSYDTQPTFQHTDGTKISVKWDTIDTTTMTDKEYAKVDTTGEKKSTIYLQQWFSLNGYDIVFHNNAGCEKSNIYDPIKKTYCQSIKGKGVPDLIAYNKDTKVIYVIEGEQNKPKNILNGIKQIEEDFPEWIENNIRFTFSEIKYRLATCGGDNHPENKYICYSRLLSGESRICIE